MQAQDFFNAVESRQIGTRGYHARHAGVGVEPQSAPPSTPPRKRCAEVGCTSHIGKRSTYCRKHAAAHRNEARTLHPGPRPIVGRVR